MNPDYFDRQRRIPEWQQDLIEEQVVFFSLPSLFVSICTNLAFFFQVGFCLGVGGLGCSVALELVRLGFKRIYLLDNDVVDTHNLNRQILFSKDDIGKPKVRAFCLC
jgi:hypothetical protein